jgi:hypothetical protein
VGFCGIFEHFPRFEFFLLPSIIHARPHAGNASRWVLRMKRKIDNEIKVSCFSGIIYYFYRLFFAIPSWC